MVKNFKRPNSKGQNFKRPKNSLGWKFEKWVRDFLVIFLLLDNNWAIYLTVRMVTFAPYFWKTKIIIRPFKSFGLWKICLLFFYNIQSYFSALWFRPFMTSAFRNEPVFTCFIITIPLSSLGKFYVFFLLQDQFPSLNSVS